MQLQIDDHFIHALPSDPDRSNQRRQVVGAAYSFVTPRVPSQPTLLHAAADVAAMIGLSAEDLKSKGFTDVFSGAVVPEGADPYAMCYGGHQFGNWAGQLGDGRAINLAEVSHEGVRHTLQLKGAGETPYSRMADGLAVLRSSLREHLCSEAMFHLGVATTRSLSLIATGDAVLRDVMYDGHPEYEPGAVVCRVAPSFIRFGSFEILASRGEIDLLRQLADYTIGHYFPTLDADAPDYIEFFREVSQRTMAMIVDWQRVGFVHGVMNTDNMSIHGVTIDYGPYGWLEGYDHGWTPNTTDRQHRRYRYGNQPQIALWNLAQLASAISPLVDDVQPLRDVLEDFQQEFPKRYFEMMAAKIGLDRFQAGDEALCNDLEDVLQLTETDMTIFFRRLASIPSDLDLQRGVEFLQPVADAFYDPAQVTGEVLERWRSWFTSYTERLRQSEETQPDRMARMNSVNPKYVLRNYMAQMAIDKATQGDLSLIDELYDLLRDPYAEQPDRETWFAKRPDWARDKVGCSMLSCSS
ncbi:protein adenylyltransferase SelO [Rosistilla oblonga]|uniref:protein adenylyltransferase SelO n=1 Tax=Rosistilla oblonga TaxID=2527990 RepID=UPI003A96933E